MVLAGPCYGQAGGISDLDAIRNVVERQLTAVRRGQGAVAYQLASPQIRQQFPTAASFMRMIRESYPQLVNHRRFAFLDMQATPTGFAQGVRLTNGAGRMWRALYTLEKEPNGAWVISGCRIEPYQPDR